MFRTSLGELDSFRVCSTVFKCTNMALADDSVLYTDRTRFVTRNFQ